MEREEKCKKCRKVVGRNAKSICCDSCDRWYHFKCSGLSVEQFSFHSKNELEFWRCHNCVPFRCKCNLIVRNNQNSILCNICETWVHLKCSGLTKNELSHLSKTTLDWYCRWCIADALPFYNIENKKLEKLLQTNKKVNIPANAIRLCKICDKGNLARNSALYCRSCKHLLHKKCAGREEAQIIDLCSKCRQETFPFYLCTREEILKDNHNNINVCKPCSILTEEDISLPIQNTEILNLFENIHNVDSQESYYNDSDINSTHNVNFDFYDMHKFHKLTRRDNNKDTFSLIHSNIESLCAKEERLKLMITNLDFSFDVIALTETWNQERKKHKYFAPILEGYHCFEGMTGNTLKGVWFLYKRFN